MLTEHVEEYPEERETIDCAKPYMDDYVWVRGEQSLDMDPTCALRKSSRSALTHGCEQRRCCVPGCKGPITPLSDYGFWDFSVMPTGDNRFDFEDDVDEPEWAALCWEHARPMYYLESDIVDPKTGIRATDGIHDD